MVPAAATIAAAVEAAAAMVAPAISAAAVKASTAMTTATQMTTATAVAAAVAAAMTAAATAAMMLGVRGDGHRRRGDHESGGDEQGLEGHWTNSRDSGTGTIGEPAGFRQPRTSFATASSSPFTNPFSRLS